MAKDMYQKRRERKEKAMAQNDTQGGVKKTDINWFPGHMQKTKRLIKEKYNLIDIVYELVDSRIPYSSKIKDIDELIKNKPKILIMTKKDLCDLDITNKWMKYYEEKGYKVILANLNDPNEYKKILNLTHEMMETLQTNRAEKGIIKKEIKALVIGIPNVGKSTLINRMAGKTVAQVGNKPGITKSLSWLKTNSDILLLDSPGILWPRLDDETVALNLASMGAIKSEILPIDEVAVYILNMLEKHYCEKLEKRYGISSIDENLEETYNKIGRKIGAIISGGEIDYDRVSATILNDIKKEFIKQITFDRR